MQHAFWPVRLLHSQRIPVPAESTVTGIVQLPDILANWQHLESV